MPTYFYDNYSGTSAFDYIEKIFPIPFYEKNTLQYDHRDYQVVVSGLVLDSLDRVREFFLVHADQDGWCLDFEMLFQDLFLLNFKKAKRAAIVICRRDRTTHVKVEIYIKY